ncbi:MAG: 30S ribosomal protein S7 [Candidatus Marinimicrobia bacterium]|nr:30S ribosomal protein S7 [Candidatus Neomarinimicrobiota bacterium]MCF7827468.1 30S ribosomal protein S7 [Candidatus Neomarinimicrobiota bacterium]MCF7882419.1 30S ribosomal protein S7 [Candidatus Neomarinimicrobiota bacterium]
MARRKRPERREILPDPVHDSLLVAKFINNIMRSGKRGTAEQIFYTALEKMEKQAGKDGLELFEKAIDNASPILEVKSKRIGGATYQVPIEVSKDRKKALAMRWLISAAKGRGGRPMSDRLAEEFLAASKGDGGAVRKKEEVHRMAEANKAFAHFR